MKILALALILVSVAGCLQLSSMADGATGVPMDEATKAGDMPGWYHFGHFLAIGVSDLLALLRIALPLILSFL